MEPSVKPAPEAAGATQVPVTRSKPDLVERTRDERSLVKLVTLAVPGYRGYRQREDVRQADALLRAHAAREIEAALASVKDARTQMSRRLELGAMPPLAEALGLLEAALLEIRHAEQGYADSRSALRVTEEDLLRLYEHDARLVEIAAAVRAAHAALPASPEALAAALAAARATTESFRSAVAGRRRAMLVLE